MKRVEKCVFEKSHTRFVKFSEITLGTYGSPTKNLISAFIMNDDNTFTERFIQIFYQPSQSARLRR